MQILDLSIFSIIFLTINIKYDILNIVISVYPSFMMFYEIY